MAVPTDIGSAKTESGLGKNLFWYAGTKASCSMADMLSIMTDQRNGDETLLKFASAVKLRSMPRSQDYLANYMNGTKDDRVFDLAELLQDAGVRRVVCRYFSGLSCRGSNVITIRQGDYDDPDWKNALGTYFIYYLDLGPQRDVFGRENPAVLAWGEDTYQWHPDDTKRFTQCIHQAADRLRVPFKGLKAENFKMRTPPVKLDTKTLLCSPPRSEPKTFVHDINRATRLPPDNMCREK